MTLGEALEAMWQQWMLDLAHMTLEGAGLGLIAVLWVVTMLALGVHLARETSK